MAQFPSLDELVQASEARSPFPANTGRLKHLAHKNAARGSTQKF